MENKTVLILITSFLLILIISSLIIIVVIVDYKVNYKVKGLEDQINNLKKHEVTDSEIRSILDNLPSSLNYSKDFDKLNFLITNLQERIKQLQKENQDLEDSIDDLENELNQLKSKVNLIGVIVGVY